MRNRLGAWCASTSHISCNISGSFRFVLRPREAVRVLAALGLTGAILSLPANALISPTSPVGATPGTFAVSPSGAATYTIPIVVPPGVNGLQPNLALVYNSQGGNGLLGMGWGLSGLSVIHRCGATIELDGFKGGVNYDANDRFCLDGDRLIRVGTSTEYRTEKESLQKVQAADTTTNPAWFTVTGPDGTVREYFTPIEAAGNPSIRRLWALSKVRDKHNNTVTISYDKSDVNLHGDYRPTTITYTGGANTVEFQYKTRNDVTPMYEGGSVIRTLKRLTNVTSKANGTTVREYRLGYDANGAVGRYRLTSVQECGTDNACLPATQLNFDIGNVGFISSFQGPAYSDAGGWGIEQYYSTIQYPDLNGDGKADICARDSGGIQCWIGTGSGFTSYFAGPAYSDAGGWSYPQYYSTIKYADLNGDGKRDITARSSGGIGALTSPYGIGDLLSSVITGLGARSDVVYKSLTDTSIYTKDAGPTYVWGYPYQEVQAPTYVVSQASVTNGLNGGLNTTTYQYGGLKNHQTAAQSLGFRWMQTTDPAGLIHVTYNNQNREAGTDGTVALTETFANGVRIKQVRNNWVSRAPDGVCTRRPQPQLASSVEETRELNNSVVTSVTTTNTYDSCGFPTQTVVDMGGGHKKTTVNQYTHDTANWRLGLVTRTDVISEAPGQTAQTRTASFDYDYLGRLTAEVIAPGTPLAVTTTYSNYDAFGHWTQRTVSGADIEPRTESQTFDARGLFIASKTNALGHTTSFVYDERNGQPTRITDPNGLVTEMDYDGFGRKGKETRPDGITTTIRYESRATGYAVRTDTPGAANTYTDFDILGREIRTATVAFGSTPGAETWIVRTKRYDALGRLIEQSQPHFLGQTPELIKMTHDLLGRVTSVTEPGPGNRTTTTAYSGLTTTVTNPLGQSKTSVKDVQGRTVSVTDNAGTVNYQYDAVGNLTQVTGVDGAVTAMQYDARGRKTAMQDPDMGNWTYGYDVLGQLKEQRDAKNQLVTMTYDKLGRLQTKVTPDGTSTWTYDTALRGSTGQPLRGALAQVAKSTDNYSESYTYDNYGRLKTSTINAGSALTTTHDYDTYGRLEYLTYPTGFKVRQLYDGFGYLYQVNRVAGTESLLWLANAADSHARIIDERFGNGLVTLRGYDPVTNDLQTIQTGVAGNPTSIQNLSYTFDAIDNLLTRTDASPGINVTETFGYDNVNRLTQSTVQGSGVNITKTYNYNAAGNITYKSDVGTYTYGSSRPHAVTQVQGVVNASYTYDANGNQTSGGGRSITYTSFNKPKTIVGANGTTTLYYDANDNRVKKTTATSTTVYVGKLYEHVTTGSLSEHKHYIYGGKSLVATHTERNNGTPAETRYVHSDHLDSINVITDANGNVVQRLSFDPHGKRRNTNGSDATQPITSTINRGYTRHEHDDEVGLINMNARLYDPIIGRFISPDTIIPNAGNSQAYNRYTYVKNSPLSLTDPTGHRSLKKAVKKIVRAHKSGLKAMHSRPALAITAAYATGGAVSNWLTSSAASAGSATAFANVAIIETAAGVTATASLTGIGQVAAGMAAGAVGGWGMSGNSRGAMYGAVSGGFGGYLSAGTAYANQVTQASNFINNVATGEFAAAGATLGRTAMNYGFSLAEASIARHYGVSPEAFNIGLMSLSIVGNELVGTRFRPNWAGFSDTGNRVFLGVNARGPQGWFFDAVDVMLGYQGLPTASTRDYLVSSSARLPVSSHSAGTLDHSYVVGNGLSVGGTMNALPFGNVAPAGVNLNLGRWDAVSGGPLGWVFNPGAHGCSVGFGGHSLDAYGAGC